LAENGREDAIRKRNPERKGVRDSAKIVQEGRGDQEIVLGYNSGKKKKTEENGGF